MAITQKFINLDKYRKLCGGIDLNDIDININDSVESINQRLYTIYNSNIISTVPQCECGYIHSRHRLGVRCDRCGGVCKEPDGNKPFLWLRDINAKFINPMFWLMLRTIMDKKIDCLKWLSDTSYNPPNKPEFLVNLLSVMGGVRSYTALVNNMDKVIEFLKHITKFKSSVSAVSELEAMSELWIKYNNDLLTSHVPIPNKNIFVMEATSKGRFINLVVGDVVNIVNEWMRITSDDVDIKRVDKYTAKAISSLASLGKTLYTDYIVSKTGLFRKHQYGARSHGTFRTTVTCIPRPHTHNQVELPWSVGLTAYEPHIINKLCKRKYTYKKACALILRSIDSYSEVISEILDELVEESNYELGIPVSMQRNPTLLQGSIQLVFGIFKKDPDDKTTSVSKLIISSPNGDYDGDCFNFTVLHDNLLAEELEVYSPYYTIPNIKDLFSVSGSFTMQGPADTVLMEYLKDEDEDTESTSLWDKELKIA